MERTGNYWSSTENSNFDAWYQRFGDGSQSHSNKTNGDAVRCVRRWNPFPDPTRRIDAGGSL